MNKKSYLIEICCYNLPEVKCAADCGADRIELCSSPSEGGTSPSAGLIREARKIFSGEIHVMIRPRAGDFIYSDEEFDAMKWDIEVAGNEGANGIVLGILHPDFSIDKPRVEELVKINPSLDCTFHRAIDRIADYSKAMHEIFSIGITSILSSGGKEKALQGLDRLKAMVKWEGGKMKIRVASGVDESNVQQFWEAGLREFHFTAYKRNKDAFGMNALFRNDTEPDPEKILSVKNKLENIARHS